MNRLPQVATMLLPAMLVMGRPGPVQAEKIDVVPVTGNASLTMSTDESYGYQVFPRSPCRIKLVGPGRLTVTIRLNHTRKLPVLRGRLTISRNGRRIKRANLKLHRSRVGRYRELPRLHPSLPKVFRIKVPRGLQEYTLAIRGRRGLSMTVGFGYESQADQSAARGDEALALVPLVPPKPAGPPAGSGESEMPPLVPLVPPPAPDKQPVAEKPRPAAQPRSTAASTPAAKPPATDRPKPPPRPDQAAPTAPRVAKVEPPAAAPPAPAPSGKPALGDSSTAAATGDKPQVRQLVTTVAQPPKVTAPAPRRRLPVFSLGVKFGQISPLQKVGGTTYTGSLDLRYILPVFAGRLSLGVEAGYYRYQLTVTSEQRRLTMTVIPVAVQAFYRFPIGAVIAPYLGAGADLFVCLGSDSHTSTGFEYSSTTKFTFGGHLAGGIEAKLGPGYLLGEVRAGMSFGDPGVWANSPNIYGLLAVAGYRFVF